ncbi:MAG: hypothetical protein GTO22_19080, partial [Gemmatimonadales bacterium]|nr:hypothetical protein [Gemmatimonadales bacterium]
MVRQLWRAGRSPIAFVGMVAIAVMTLWGCQGLGGNGYTWTAADVTNPENFGQPKNWTPDGGPPGDAELARVEWLDTRTSTIVRFTDGVVNRRLEVLGGNVVFDLDGNEYTLAEGADEPSLAAVLVGSDPQGNHASSLTIINGTLFGRYIYVMSGLPGQSPSSRPKLPGLIVRPEAILRSRPDDPTGQATAKLNVGLYDDDFFCEGLTWCDRDGLVSVQGVAELEHVYVGTPNSTFYVHNGGRARIEQSLNGRGLLKLANGADVLARNVRVDNGAIAHSNLTALERLEIDQTYSVTGDSRIMSQVGIVAGPTASLTAVGDQSLWQTARLFVGGDETDSWHNTNIPELPQGLLSLEDGASAVVDESFKVYLAGSVELDNGNILGSEGLVVDVEGRLCGTGQIRANLANNGGTVCFPGMLRISGGYTQMANGTLETLISGRSLGTDYGEFQVEGPASLSGTLVVTIASDFALAPEGETFALLRAGMLAGTFDQIEVNGA